MVRVERLRNSVRKMHEEIQNPNQATTQSAFRRVVDPDDIAAKYKLEVHFSQERSAHRPFGGSVHFWLSGTQFHGGGDEVIYPCPSERCVGLIPPKLNNGGLAVCPTCKQRWSSDNDLKEATYYKLPLQKWVEVVARDWQRLESNADIYLKFHPVDIQELAMIELNRGCGGEKVDHVRNSRRRVIYSLASMMKDLNAGADLNSRVLGFLTS